MRIRSGWGAGVVWAVTACGDLAVQPAAERAASAVAMTTAVPVGCDRIWASPVSGRLIDSLRWSPVGVPTPYDHLCFGGGPYAVNLVLADVAQLRILPGADVSLEMPWAAPCSAVTYIAETAELWVEPGAVVTIRTCILMDVTSATRIDGTLVVNSDYDVGFRTGSLLNFGVLELTDQALTVRTSGPLGLVNAGEMRVSGHNTISVTGPTRSTLGGVGVTGSGTVRVDGVTGSTFEWTGGAFPPRLANGAAPVSIAGLSVTLGALASGAVDIESAPVVATQVFGHIGSALDVALIPMAAFPAGGTVFLEPPAGSAPGTSVLLQGALAVRNVALESTSPIRNSGTLLFGKATSNPGLSVNRMRGPTFDNTGTVTALDSTRIENVSVSNTGVMRTIGGGGKLVISGGTYTVDPAGSMSGTLSVEALGVLSGNGTVDRVISVGGVVSPGSTTAPVGSLTFTALTLDATSRVDVDVAGTTSMDRLVASTQLTRGGTMSVRTLAPFIGGLCGQVVTPMTTTKTGTFTGGFNQYLGSSLTPTSRWRPYVSTSSVSLVGHDPSRLLGLASRAVAVTEGGSSATMQLCFSGTGPTANVTVTAAPRLGQSTVLPSPLVVTPSSWALPQTVTVRAIDDLIAEPPHADSIRLGLTSTDAVYNGPVQQQLAVAITDNDLPVDLAVSLVGLNNAVNRGQTLERRFRVTNVGSVASTGSTFSIPALAGATFISSPGAACAMSGADLQCTVGPLAAGAWYELLVVFRASATAGTYTNTLSVRGNEWDSVAGNNTAPWVLIVN